MGPFRSGDLGPYMRKRNQFLGSGTGTKPGPGNEMGPDPGPRPFENYVEKI